MICCRGTVPRFRRSRQLRLLSRRLQEGPRVRHDRSPVLAPPLQRGTAALENRNQELSYRSIHEDRREYSGEPLVPSRTPSCLRTIAAVRGSLLNYSREGVNTARRIRTKDVGRQTCIAYAWNPSPTLLRRCGCAARAAVEDTRAAGNRFTLPARLASLAETQALMCCRIAGTRRR